MGNLFEDIVGLFGYKDFITGAFSNIIETMIAMFLLKMILEIIINVAGIRAVTDMLFIPFRYLHTWAHTHKANQINAKAKREKIARVDKDDYLHPSERYFYPKIAVKASMFSSLTANEFTRLGFYYREPLTMKEVLGFAYAPSKYGILFTFLVLLSGQMAAANPFFLFAHFYFFIGSLLYLFPSKQDYEYVLNNFQSTNTLSPAYMVWGLVVFFVMGFAHYTMYEQLGFPPGWDIETLKAGLLYTFVYYILIMLVLMFTGPDETLVSEHEATWRAYNLMKWQERYYEEHEEERPQRRWRSPQDRRRRFEDELLEEEEMNYYGEDEHVF